MFNQLGQVFLPFLGRHKLFLFQIIIKVHIFENLKGVRYVQQDFEKVFNTQDYADYYHLLVCSNALVTVQVEIDEQY